MFKQRRLGGLIIGIALASQPIGSTCAQNNTQGEVYQNVWASNVAEALHRVATSQRDLANPAATQELALLSGVQTNLTATLALYQQEGDEPRERPRRERDRAQREQRREQPEPQRPAPERRRREAQQPERSPQAAHPAHRERFAHATAAAQRAEVEGRAPRSGSWPN